MTRLSIDGEATERTERTERIEHTDPPAQAADATEADGGTEAADGGAADAAEAPVAPLSDAKQIVALELEVAELKEAHTRALADYLNYRRRSEQHWTERARATLADAVSRYLPLLDDLDRAVANVDGDISGHQWVDGIRLVHQKFHETIAGSGLETIATAGLAFDPRVHEAIAFAPGPQGQIIEAVRAGYAIQDHVVRPAQVVVGDGNPPPEAEQQR